MQWSSDAFILSWRAFGEGQAIVSLLAAGHGRWRGVVPGGGSRSRRHLLQQGTRVAATWRARHADQLGTLTCEPTLAVPTRVLHHPLRLAALAAACSLLDAALPEREPNDAIYRGSLVLFQDLAAGPDWLAAYADWEASLLADLGFGFAADAATATAKPDPAAGQAILKTRLTRHLLQLEESVFSARRPPLPFARQRLAELVARLR